MNIDTIFDDIFMNDLETQTNFVILNKYRSYLENIAQIQDDQTLLTIIDILRSTKDIGNNNNVVIGLPPP